ncbi:MAG: ATP-dependent helicase, partial [Acidobacteria bacterium]|nr:ATP-dependent helicase [Acidobacteriota bacterium]
IALSATVKPLSVVADFVGGYRVERDGGRGGTDAAAAAAYIKRKVEVVHCPHAKSYEMVISFPGGTPERPMWHALAAECRAIIRTGRSTLFFVNSRRHAEKLSRLINEGEAETLAWSHHGSLSRELRLVVEERLKRGELKAIVATSSLELGIDIGALDRVVLVQTPFSVASAVQRMGRAGHGVGQASRAVIFPLHGRDIIDAAVTARCVREQDIESIEPVICPLDVLAQLIVSMTSVETWSVEELYDEIRASAPFHALPRRHFDLVLAMLAGRYEETRLRELAPLVSLDRIEGTVRAREGARLRLATSGGTIPDRGYFSLRTADTKALLGELDEEFVWERSVGDSFILGTQAWRIQAIGHQDVEVAPVSAKSAMPPFWKAEERNRGFHVSQRIARALEDWNGKVGEPGFADELAQGYGLERGAALALSSFLVRQKEATRADLPHRHHLLVEHARDTAGYRIALHTLWGGRVNRPFSLALSAAWEERFGRRPECFQTDDTILLIDAEDHPAAEILALVRPENVERLLRKRLEGSGFFGARFRENAARALLLPRASVTRRMPLWLTRLRAKALYVAASKYDDFPLLIETWRTCLRDEFDMESLAMLLGEIDDGTIRIGEAATGELSPFCGDIAWKQANSLMYADDAPGGEGRTALRGDLVRELALSAQLRPRISRESIDAFQAKIQRIAEGYAPRDAREMLDWLKERVLLPRGEWDAVLAACERDAGARREDIEAELAGRTLAGNLASSDEEAVAARETPPRLRRSLEAGSGE